MQVQSDFDELGLEVAVGDVKADCAVRLPLHPPIAAFHIVLQLLDVCACRWSLLISVPYDGGQ